MLYTITLLVLAFFLLNVSAFTPIARFRRRSLLNYGNRRLYANKMNYYDILGLETGASPEEIKKAFREKARLTHPDASRTTDTTKEFLMIKEAYETLYDARRRAEFDRKRKITEVAELAVNVGEILATDVAIPLARDVALPLIKSTFNGIDRTIVGPLLEATMKNSAIALENIKAMSTDQVSYFQAMQASWKAQEVKQLGIKLEEITQKAKLSQKEANELAQLLSKCLEEESMATREFDEEVQRAEAVNARSAQLQREGEIIMTSFRARVQEEERCRRTVRRLESEQSKASVLVRSKENIVNSAQNDLVKAEEFLLMAQRRRDEALKVYNTAADQLAETQMKAQTLQNEFNASTRELEEAVSALEPERRAWEEVQEKERELNAEYFRRLNIQRSLKAQMAEVVRKREVVQKDFERAHRGTSKYQDQALQLAQTIERKFQESQAGSNQLEDMATTKAAAAAANAAAALNGAQQQEKAKAPESLLDLMMAQTRKKKLAQQQQQQQQQVNARQEKARTTEGSESGETEAEAEAAILQGMIV